MTRPPETRLLAYLDRWSAAPGQHVAVHASGPAGAAEVELTDLVSQTVLGPATPVTVEPRRVRTGSHLEAADVPVPARGGVAVWLRPHERRDAGARQVVAELAAGGWRLLVTLEETGHPGAAVETRSGSLRVRSGPAVPHGSWSLLVAAWEAEPSGTRLRLAVRGGARDDAAAHGAGPPPPQATATLRFGAGADHGDPYAGRLALPLLTGNALTPGDCDTLAGLTTGPALARHLGDGLVALWDPAADPGAPVVPDISGNARHARAVNRPLAGLAGPGGDGTRTALQLSPEDLDDARWPRTCAVTVPAGTGSTVLGVRVRAGGDSYVVPLVVRPESPADPASPENPVAVVLPTFTYLAYANHRQSSEAEYFGDYSTVTDRGIELSGTDAYLNEHRELGLSLYDQRREGGPVYHSSGRRPVLNHTPGYRWWMTGAPRHFAADLLLLRWLRAEGFAFDVLTDEDVHAGGAALLARYRVVLTGSHPEYVSAPEREAVAAYVSGGGRLMYLGGNGFYWVTGVDPRHPHAIEVRRGHTGAWWDNEPGEDVLTSTGEPGGLWRERGLPPQELLGVGFAAQGWGPAPGFTRLPDSYRAEAAWVFDGVPGPVVGRHGLALGGAAGDEIDRADPGLGTPPGTLLLATSAGGHSGHYQNAPEEARLGAEAVRADMTLRPTRAGGAVFAAGSINWVASLACCDGDVRRVTRNVLSRFLSPKPSEE
ncbi:N,N-dimethylformamidase beta subunit family domain-containing protein [Streptosporangium sp. V21-05]|uniref:N,N-dimethylformamidase beta subunit family domain-containing protein n=1 Tax=Streptosporangium sp. V21-05 TaxID=3446115 RepID=UPI003F532966